MAFTYSIIHDARSGGGWKAGTMNPISQNLDTHPRTHPVSMLPSQGQITYLVCYDKLQSIERYSVVLYERIIFVVYYLF